MREKSFYASKRIQYFLKERCYNVENVKCLSATV